MRAGAGWPTHLPGLAGPDGRRDPRHGDPGRSSRVARPWSRWSPWCWSSTGSGRRPAGEGRCRTADSGAPPAVDLPGRGRRLGGVAPTVLLARRHLPRVRSVGARLVRQHAGRVSGVGAHVLRRASQRPPRRRLAHTAFNFAAATEATGVVVGTVMSVAVISWAIWVLRRPDLDHGSPARSRRRNEMPGTGAVSGLTSTYFPAPSQGSSSTSLVAGVPGTGVHPGRQTLRGRSVRPRRWKVRTGDGKEPLAESIA